MKGDFQKQIDNLSKKGGFISSKPYFIGSSEFSNSNNSDNEIEFKSTNSNNSLLIIIGIVSLVLSLRFKESIFFYPLLIFIAITMTINFIYLKTKKVKTIKINSLGFEIDNIKYNWDEVHDFSVKVNPNKYLTFYHLIIFSNSKGKKEHNLFSFQSQQDNIINNLNCFREKHSIKNKIT
jgi:hypothetical protein